MTTATKSATGPCRPEEPLADVRHEKFVQLLAAGRKLAQAYREAGFASKSSGAARANACRLAARAEIAARRLHLRLKAATDANGPVSREAKIAILEGLIRDQSLTPADRLRAIEAHTRFEADEDAMPRMDPGLLCDWLCNGTERDGKTQELLCRVFYMLAEIWRITPDRLAKMANEWSSQGGLLTRAAGSILPVSDEEATAGNPTSAKNSPK